jgi:hypothetical protein
MKQFYQAPFALSPRSARRRSTVTRLSESELEAVRSPVSETKAKFVIPGRKISALFRGWTISSVQSISHRSKPLVYLAGPPEYRKLP